MILLGLTGSIGMGKSTTAKMLRDLGAPVYDADAAVHRLYEGAGVAPVGAVFPQAICDGRVDRAALSDIVLKDAEALRKLESIVHPLLGADRAQFMESARARGAPLVVLDIPLLFETGGDKNVDVIVVVSAPADVQEARVLERGTMSREKFLAIRAKQTPDAQKRRQAHFVIDTSLGLEPARRQARALLRAFGL